MPLQHLETENRTSLKRIMSFVFKWKTFKLDRLEIVVRVTAHIQTMYCRTLDCLTNTSGLSELKSKSGENSGMIEDPHNSLLSLNTGSQPPPTLV